MAEPIQLKDSLLATLPANPSNPKLLDRTALFGKKIDTIIVLDDDPTGTQTVYDVPVLTHWSTKVLEQEFKKQTPVFYILTNSRSLTETEAITLTKEIGHQIKLAAKKTGTRFWVISRGDSTLRGHYPAEMDALENSLELRGGVQFIIPAFFEGGRYTINNVHYVQQGTQMIPAAQTIYAKDHVFAYQSSNLIDWIVEKTNGRIQASEIETIDIPMLRQESQKALARRINTLGPNTVCIVNAANYADLHAFSQAISNLSSQPVFRTAASFVASIAGLAPKSLLGREALLQNNEQGGLLVVGSYVETTTRQLNHLLKYHPSIRPFEISIPQILALEETNVYTRLLSRQIDQAIESGQSVVLYTSRDLVSAQSSEEKQEIGKKVSKIVTDVVRQLEKQPSFLLSKGGITSSDIATKSLGIKRAMVLGQVIKGVPVWRLGKETKFPGSIQIIFPGNVGQESSLTDIVNVLST